jgi:hypothetical protein
LYFRFCQQPFTSLAALETHAAESHQAGLKEEKVVSHAMISVNHHTCLICNKLITSDSKFIR